MGLIDGSPAARLPTTNHQPQPSRSRPVQSQRQFPDSLT